MRGQENSRPSVNSRNTTPSSASRCVVSDSGNSAEGVRPQRQADGDVAQDGRQPEAPRQRHDENRRG